MNTRLTLLDVGVMDEPALDETLVEESALAPDLLKNDFTELEKRVARSKCFFPFMRLVYALTPPYYQFEIFYSNKNIQQKKHLLYLQPVFKTIFQQPSKPIFNPLFHNVEKWPIIL